MYQQPSWATQDFQDWAATHTPKKKKKPHQKTNKQQKKPPPNKKTPKTKIPTKWKQEKATKEECRSIDQVFRETARKAKTLLQLKLVMDINSNKRNFYHYISIKSLIKENMGYLLNRDCDLKPVGLGKTEVLHNFFTLSFADTIPRP